MRDILIMPDSFKGTMSAVEVCEITASAIREVLPQARIRSVPMADGGEGTLDCFRYAFGGETIWCRVTGAFGDKKDACYWKKGELAVVELAQAAGFSTDPEKRDPSIATTYGVGELIKQAADNGAAHILLALGGSCTNDAGAGMAQALGAEFRNAKGELINPAGGNLHQIAAIDISSLHPYLSAITFEAMCDIDNPLYGENGAACIFAPQKGADSEMVKRLDGNLKAFSQRVFEELHIDAAHLPGAGAAGGTAYGAAVFLKARLKRGVDCILDQMEFEKSIRNCDLVITGEGCLDEQSLRGKTVIGIAKRAKKQKVPVAAVVGSTRGDLRGIEKYGVTDIAVAGKKGRIADELLKTCRRELREAVKGLVIRKEAERIVRTPDVKDCPDVEKAPRELKR